MWHQINKTSTVIKVLNTSVHLPHACSYYKLNENGVPGINFLRRKISEMQYNRRSVGCWGNWAATSGYHIGKTVIVPYVFNGAFASSFTHTSPFDLHSHPEVGRDDHLYSAMGKLGRSEGGAIGTGCGCAGSSPVFLSLQHLQCICLWSQDDLQTIRVNIYLERWIWWILNSGIWVLLN